MMNDFKMFFILLFVSFCSYGQVDNDSIRQVVLKNNIKDSLYVFGQWKETFGTETHLKYLGIVRSKIENYKIMTSCWIWGLSKRATNRILVFTEDNEYLGNYCLTMKSDLPEKIENNQIVFLHSESKECDKKLITRLSFMNGIPKQFFLECKDGYGDVYSFDEN